MLKNGPVKHERKGPLAKAGPYLEWLDISWTFFEVFLPYVELIPGSDFLATVSKILARTLFFEKRPCAGRDVLCAQKRPG